MLIQFSPIRSGSTLIYNYLMGLGKQPQKSHNYRYLENVQYVIAIRHPYNAIISSILRYGQQINTGTVMTQMAEYLENGGYDIATSEFDPDSHCVFLYEKFYADHNVILDGLESFFNESYSTETKDELKQKLSVNNVKEKIAQFRDFYEYDRVTHLHGNHISEFNGQTDYNTLLKEKELKMLASNDHLQRIINKYY